MRPLALASAALLLVACADDRGTDPAGPDPDPDDSLAKVDGPVRERLGEGGPLPVLILGRTQHLLGPDALADFIERNRGRTRSSVGREFVDLLRATAAREQRELLAFLEGRSRYRVPLWIVNGVAAVVDPETVRELARRDDVRYILDSDVSLAGFVSPLGVAEVLTPGETGFEPAGRPVAWYLDELGVPGVWEELGVTGEGVVIALLDTGVEYRHTDVRRRMWTNPGEVANNGVDDDGNGFVDDYYGFDLVTGHAEVLPGDPHGAYVSGILVGDGTAGKVTGVAPGARIMALRVGRVVGNLRALEYALVEGADVVNMSFSLPDLGNLRGVWRLAADHATAAGLVLVSGAGNFGETEPVPVQLRTPEDVPSVLAVGGIDRDGRRAAFSGRGPVEWASVRFYRDYPLPAGLTKPDLVAFPGPGYALLDPTGGYVDPNFRAGLRGNSFSGPQAAGVAALMLSAAPELPAWEVRAILEATARDLGPPGKDDETGAGRLDARAAVEEALRRR